MQNDDDCDRTTKRKTSFIKNNKQTFTLSSIRLLAIATVAFCPERSRFTAIRTIQGNAIGF